MEKLRLAVVGVGAYDSSRARGYLAIVQKLTDLYTLCAVCDQREESLRAVAERFSLVPSEAEGGVRCYTGVEKMLETEKPDVVFVLVPTDGQTPVALTAARHQCHVITEIPYALTLAFGDAIAQACRENGVKWEIAENVWRWPNEQLKQQIVQSGALGQLTHARLWYTSGAYHGFNAVRMILGSEPKRALGYARAVDVPAYVSYGGSQETKRWWESGVIEFENGATCLYEMPPSSSVRGSHWELEGTAGYLSGDALTLYQDGRPTRYPFQTSCEAIDNEQVLSTVSVETHPPIVWENPFKRYRISNPDDVAKASILQSLHRAVTENVAPAYGAANARRDMELWIALRESAARGNRWIDLPLVKATELEDRLRAEYVRRYGADPMTDAKVLLNAAFNRLSVMWSVAGWL
jgi:predicted dehydrogenase